MYYKILFKILFWVKPKDVLLMLQKQTHSILRMLADDFFEFEDNTAEKSEYLTAKVKK